MAIGLLTWHPAFGDAEPGNIPVPQDFQPCAPSDPAIRMGTRLAAEIATTFLACFRSQRETLLPRDAKPALVLFDHATAMALPGRNHTQADIDKALSTVRKQWAGFNPSSADYQTYLAWIHDFMQRNGRGRSRDMAILKPILVSIDGNEGNFYCVTSIRPYSFEDDGEQLTVTMVHSSSILLRRSELVSLTITRILRDPTDVDQTRAAIAAWARAAAVTGVP